MAERGRSDELVGRSGVADESATAIADLRKALAFYADRRNHRGVGTGPVYNDNGRVGRRALGRCPTCLRYNDGLGYVPTGGVVRGQDGCDPEYKLCPDCHGAGFVGAAR